jgi:hypothetical protein
MLNKTRNRHCDNETMLLKVCEAVPSGEVIGPAKIASGRR